MLLSITSIVALGATFTCTPTATHHLWCLLPRTDELI
jgi:hypothetical protein